MKPSFNETEEHFSEDSDTDNNSGATRKKNFSLPPVNGAGNSKQENSGSKNNL
jgi:hypothetical protein